MGGPGIRWTASTLGNPAHTPAPGRPGSGEDARGEGPGKNLEVPVARGRPGPLARTAPSGAWSRVPLPAPRDPRCRRRGAARAVGAGRLPPSKPPASAAAFAPGGGPARREPGPLPASEPSRASCWRQQRQRRQRGWRAGRRLLAQRRRPGPALLGTLKNFPGARLAAVSRESLGRAPPPKSESAEPQRALFPSQTAPGQRRGETEGREPRARWRPARALGRAGRGAGGLGLALSPAPQPWPQCRDCTCRRPPSRFLGGKR